MLVPRLAHSALNLLSSIILKRTDITEVGLDDNEPKYMYKQENNESLCKPRIVSPLIPYINLAFSLSANWVSSITAFWLQQPVPLGM